MKKTRKIPSLILAFAMLLSMGVTANAAEVSRTIPSSKIAVIAEVGTVVYEKDVPDDYTRGTSKPTSEAPSYPHSGNWSGTVNYVFTNYYFNNDNFDAEADGTFKAYIYEKDGTYVTTVYSTDQLSNKEEIRIYTYMLGDYYIKFVNTSGSAATNATYTAY